MDAKSRANFINSVADGSLVPCPNCGSANKPEAKFCVTCGSAMAAPKAADNTPAFGPATDKSNTPAFAPASAPADNNAAAAPAFAPAPAAPVSTYVEPASVFAEGLPEWSLEPPQVMVRRR